MKSYNKYLKSVDWTTYLEREHEFILFDAFWPLYGKRLKQETGFGMTHFLCYFKNGVGVWYRSQTELDGIDKHFATLIRKKDARINKWLLLEKKFRTEFNHKPRKLSPSKSLNLFKDILFYNTVLPLRLLSALKLTQDPNLKKKLDKIRADSIYFQAFKLLIIPLIKQAAKKSNLTYKTASLLLMDELLEVLEKKKIFYKNELLKREKGCYFYSENYHDYNFIFSSKDFLSNVNKNIKILSGQTAFSGKATGQVKIVNTPLQVRKLHKGNILVSINTNPALILAIKRCAAIVTDEGGMTCHAAIISRELKKPCIVGTKVATKILKDGDIVEVNASKGIVKII